MNININLNVTPAGAELIVKALRAVTPLPDAQVDAFVAQLWAQYQEQMRDAAAAAQAQASAEEPAPAPADEAVGGTD